MTNESPVIHDAETEDLPPIREMLEEYATWLGVDLSFQHFAEEIERLPGDYARPAGALLIARSEGRPVGMVALRAAGEHRGEIKRLYVRPEARGLCLGRRLAERVIDEARARGYAEIILDTLPVMQDAQRLYVALGFRDIPPYYPSPIRGTRYMALSLRVSADEFL